MKEFLLLLFVLLITRSSFGACDSPLSRTNYSANQVLTSTALNADLNQLITGVNTVDGSCLSDDTVTFAKLDSTSFAVPLNAIKQGLKVVRNDAASLLVEKGWAAVNGAWTTNSTAKSIDHSCSGCAAESASTLYYVYLKTGVSATMATTDLLISTTAPDSHGYDTSSNLILARYYQDADSNIDQYSIDQWDHGRGSFVPQSFDWVDAGAFTIDGATTDPTQPTYRDSGHFFKREGSSIVIKAYQSFSASGSVGSGNYHIALPTTPAFRFATGVDGAQPWTTGGSLGSTFGIAYGSAGTFFCRDEGSGIDMVGQVLVRSATSYRVAYQNNANTQFYWFSSTGQCQYDATDHSLGWDFRAKVEGWND